MNPNIKKYLPFILLGVGVVVLVIVFWIVKGKKEVTPTKEEEVALMEVALADRPVVSLSPDAEGHYLTLKVSKLLKSASKAEYILEYRTKEGVNQGTSGEIDMANDTYENNLLLGTESSGKFRYDNAVENGSITILFRNDKGKLLTKFRSEFHMQKDATELTSTDGKFKYTLNKAPKGVLYLTMPSIGILADAPAGSVVGNYVLMAASANVPGSLTAGSVSIEGSTVYKFDNGWKKLEDGKDDTSAGYYIGIQ